MNFDKYIGIPYAEKGRDINGLDCYGLVRLVYKNEYDIDLPSFTADYDADDNTRIQDLFAQYKEGWETVDQPKEGNAVLFRMMGIESHIGIVIDGSRFLHVREGRDSVIESLENAKWSKKITGYFKYTEKKNAVLNAVPHPLRTERYTIPVPTGTTLKAMAEGLTKEYGIAPELKSKITILLNGRVIKEEDWETTIIKESDTLEYRAVPKGGDTIRLVAVIAVMVAAPYLATAAWTAAGGVALGSTVGAAVYYGTYAAGMLIGSALINVIAPIRPPVAPSASERNDPGSAERQLMVNGGTNRGNPYGSIPVVLGKMRVTPLLGSNNFLTYENERDSYLSLLLVWGYGPLQIDNNSYKIGEVPLSSFTDVTKITLDRKTEPTDEVKRNFDAIYGKDVTQVNTNVELVCDGNPEVAVAPGPWFEAATSEAVNSVTLALHFPQGLRRITIKGEGSGDSFATSVVFRAEYSTNNGGSWAALDYFTIGGDSPKKDGFTFTKTYSNLNHAKMLIRVRRETGDNSEDNPSNRYYFVAILQNVTFLRNASPAIDPVGAKIAKTAFKIKASDQLNGNIEGISAVVQTWCKVWNGAAWVDGATSNPAALVRYILEHPANPRKVTNAATQINLTQLQYFYNYCETNGFEYNGILGSARSVLEVIRDVCAAGRASPALIDGKWTVIIDEAKPNVIQHFTPHNSWNFEGVKSLPKRPDGLRVTYYDQDNDYQEAEIIVYETGKTALNSSLFESITLPGVTKSSLVIDHARWHLAQMKLRPEVYTLESDIEYLVCNRGDRIKVMHDIPMWGLGSGRIKNRLSSTQLELDEDIPMKANTDYTIRVRSKTGASVTRTLTPKTLDGNYSTIELLSSTTASEVDYDDLFLFGELNQESQDLIVLSIEPSTNNTAKITMVDYGVNYEYNIFTQYATLSASTVFESQITLPPTLQVQGFGNKIPSITGFVSDESVMERVSKGVFKYNINVAYFNASELPIITDTVEVQYDLLSSDTSVNFASVFVLFQKGSANITDVKEGETYKVRMRYVGRNGKIGNWTPYSNHTVIGKTSPPIQVELFTVNANKSSGQLFLSWKPNPEYDVSTYEVRTEDTGWGVEDFRRVFYGDTTSLFIKYPGNNSVTFYIRAIDTSGNYSLVSTFKTYLTESVPNVTSISSSFSDTALTSASITLNWTEVDDSEFDIVYYQISYDSIVLNVKANSITLPANWLGNKVFNIKTVDLHNNLSSGYSESITRFAPDPVGDLRAQVIDNNVMLFWTLPQRTSLPIDHVLIKKGLVWDTAQVIGDKKGAFTTINENKGGEFTYWLAAVDTEDVESIPVSVKTLVSEPPDFIFHGEFISTFSDTKSSAYLENNRLVLPVDTTETFQQHFTTRSWTSLQSQISAGYPIFVQPALTSGYYEETFDFGQPLASSKVSLTFQGSIISGSPTVTPKISLSLDNSTFIEYNGTTDVYGLNFRYVRITITVVNTLLTGLYELTSLSVRLDAKLRNEAGNVSALSTDALGTIVNLDKSFIDIQSINLSPSGTTPLIPVYDVKDSFVSGTYSVSSNVCTVSVTSHGFITGQKIRLFSNTGGLITGVYTITSYTTNSFTVSAVIANTSGGCSLYPQSFRVYVFNNSGTRVSSTISWAIKGY